MFFQWWINPIAIAWGLSDIDASSLISMLITIAIILIALIGSKGQSAHIVTPTIGFLCMIVFILMGWVPSFVGGVLAFALAIIAGFMWSQLGSG